MVKHFFLRFSVLVVVLYSMPVFSQIAATNFLDEDEGCIAKNESVRYTFSQTQKDRKNVFVITENSSSQFYTTENDYLKINSVIYDDYSEVSNLMCTVNGVPLSNFSVLNTNYESDGIFHDDLKISAYRMEMQAGNFYSVQYQKKYYDARLFSKVYFHESYPIIKKTISFEVPDWVDVELRPINFEGYSIKFSESKLTSQKGRILIYEMEKVSAVEHEPHSPSAAKYLPHLLVFVKSYNKPNFSQTFFATHNDIYKWCKALVDSVQNDEQALLPILDEIRHDEKDSLKIMEKVFYWVQDHVRYIAFEEGIMGYKPMSAKKVCTQLYGDCKGMANLTKNLLKLAGFDARLTWIGTNEIPYDNDLPILAVYNHMICTVILGGKKYFLDATENYIAIDDYAERIQGRPVMIENGNEYISDKIPLLGYERNKHEENIQLSIKDNQLIGTAAITSYGEQKIDFLRGIAALKLENKDLSIRNYLIGDNDNITIHQFKTSDLTERSLPLTINYNFQLQNSVFSTSNNELLVLLEKDFEFQHLGFDSTRKNDFEFSNRYCINTTTLFTIPSGYTAKEIPAPLEVKTDYYDFLLKYVQEGNTIKLVKQLRIKNVLLQKVNFEKWNRDLEQLLKFYHSPLILKKI